MLQSMGLQRVRHDWVAKQQLYQWHYRTFPSPQEVTLCPLQSYPPQRYHSSFFYHHTRILTILEFYAKEISLYLFFCALFLHWNSCLWCSAPLFLASVFESNFFWLLSQHVNTPLFICPMSPFMNISLISSLTLLWIKLQQASMYKTWCGHMFSFLLDKYQGVELLDHKESNI